jgi:hypothetical protein
MRPKEDTEKERNREGGIAISLAAQMLVRLGQ